MLAAAAVLQGEDAIEPNEAAAVEIQTSRAAQICAVE